jgi:RNA polymerase sigma-70 factor (ECF subfamily)
MSASAFQSLKSLFAPADDQLMWRVQMQDDPQAFAELVRRWEQPIQRLCTRMTGSVDKSQDLAQEAFARLFARRKAYKLGGNFAAYLRRIALNLCYDELRRSGARREISLTPEDEQDTPRDERLAADGPTPDEQLDQQETGRAVRQALAALPEQYRSIVVLRHYENLKFREIAEVLGLPEGTVKTRMTEALNELSRHLKRSLGLKLNVPANRRLRPRECLVF